MPCRSRGNQRTCLGESVLSLHLVLKPALSVFVQVLQTLVSSQFSLISPSHLTTGLQVQVFTSDFSPQDLLIIILKC